MSKLYRDDIRSRPPKASPEFDNLVIELLSVRARNTLQLLDVSDEDELLKLGQQDLMAAQHCGQKTAAEILAFRNQIASGELLDKRSALEVLKDRSFLSHEDRDLAFNAIVAGMSSRAKSVMRDLNIKDLQDFATMPLTSMPYQRGAGAVTANEVRLIKTVFIDFLHDSENIPKAQRVNTLCERLFHAMITKDQPWLLDANTPYKSICDWVVATARGIEHVEKAYLMRSGLSGRKSMTLESIGTILGLTRERVRQLNNEFEDMADWIVVQRRLGPIIDLIAKKVKQKGGMMRKDALLEQLGEDEDSSEKLVHAVKFIDFISSFEPWRQRGLYHSAQEVFLKP